MENLHFEYSHAFQLITDFYVKKVPDATGMSFTFLRKKCLISYRLVIQNAFEVWILLVFT